MRHRASLQREALVLDLGQDGPVGCRLLEPWLGHRLRRSVTVGCRMPGVRHAAGKTLRHSGVGRCPAPRAPCPSGGAEIRLHRRVHRLPLRTPRHLRRRGPAGHCGARSHGGEPRLVGASEPRGRSGAQGAGRHDAGGPRSPLRGPAAAGRGDRRDATGDRRPSRSAHRSSCSRV